VTGCERVLERLRQGPATSAELYATTYCVVHSRIAELRSRGYVIDRSRVDAATEAGSHVYTLLQEPETPTARAPGGAPPVSSEGRPADPSPPMDAAGQLSLMEAA
jgi:hypothetical protein